MCKLAQLFSLHIECERARWSAATLKSASARRPLDLDKSLQLHRLLARWSHTHSDDLDHALVDGLVTLLVALLDSHGTLVGEHVLRARNLNESFTLLARKISQELFRVPKINSQKFCVFVLNRLKWNVFVLGLEIC